ncbi:hypothetical protein BDV96DRAFT_675140, partial [Lophiotrema nucula]
LTTAQAPYTIAASIEITIVVEDINRKIKDRIAPKKPREQDQEQKQAQQPTEPANHEPFYNPTTDSADSSDESADEEFNNMPKEKSEETKRIEEKAKWHIKNYAYDVHWSYATPAERAAKGLKKEPKFDVVITPLGSYYLAEVVETVNKGRETNQKWHGDPSFDMSDGLALIALEMKYYEWVIEKGKSVDKSMV